MNKHNNRTAAVSKAASAAAKTAPGHLSANSTQAQQRRLDAAPSTLSARYIDSRLKQFCLR